MQPIRTGSGSQSQEITRDETPASPMASDTLSPDNAPNASQRRSPTPGALTPPTNHSWYQQRDWPFQAIDTTSVAYCEAQLEHANRYLQTRTETRLALEQTPDHERPSIVHCMKAIYPDNDSSWYTGEVIAALAAIPADDRVQVIQLSQELLQCPRQAGFSRALRALGSIASEDRATFAACAQALFSARQSPSARAQIMGALARAPAPQWPQVVLCAAQLLNALRLDQFTTDESTIVALMADHPEPQRETFAGRLEDLAVRSMSPGDLADIGGVLARLPPNQWAAFGRCAQPLFDALNRSGGLRPVTQVLMEVDAAQIMDVLTWSLEVRNQTPAGAVSLLSTLQGMSKVPPGERRPTAAALQRFAQTQPVGGHTKDLMASLACFPADERVAAVDAVLQLPSPPKDEWLADAWLVALRHIAAPQRHAIVELIRRCIPAPLFWYDLPYVVAALAPMPADDHSGFAAFAEPWVGTLKRKYFTDVLRGLVAIRPEDRATFARYIEQLVPDDVPTGLNPAEHGPLLNAAARVWPKLTPTDSAAFAAFARRFLDDASICWAPTLGEAPIGKTLNALSRIDAAERAAFADFAARLAPKPGELSSVRVFDLSAAWDLGEDRAAFVAFAEPYLSIPDAGMWKRTLRCLTQIAPQDRAKYSAFAALLSSNKFAERAFKVASLWEHLDADDRAPFAQFAHTYVGPQTTSNEFVQTLRSLDSLPISDRAPFSDFVAQLLPANGSARFLQDCVLVIELARVLPDNRPHVITRCQALRHRHDYRTWVRRAAEAGALPDFDAAWTHAGWEVASVDRENVMNEARQNAAKAAEAALYAQYPDYTDPTHDLAALKSHLEALHAGLQVTTAEQTKQWQRFAQHMQAFSSDDAALQRLVQAMRQAPANVPAAWIETLKEFPKKVTSYAQNAPQEFMHQFYPGEDATPLASWLGHLNQFAFVDASAGFPQTPRDRHLEAFTKHVRQFEAATIPALARVRGATRATELTNAQRIFCASKGLQDVGNPINTDEAFAKLCGLIWHIVQKSPEPARRNDSHSLIWALAQCMEDDNHSVCGVGRRQRLVAVLEAQGCTPGEKLSALAEHFALTHADPQPAQVEAFVQSATQEARDTFGEGSRDMQAFRKELATYVEMTYPR